MKNFEAIMTRIFAMPGAVTAAVQHWEWPGQARWLGRAGIDGIAGWTVGALKPFV
jgi:hypothetical protein